MKKGFTLLELIVVIVIIGVLATLGFTQYSRMIENTRGAEAKAIIGGIVKNYVSYYLANGTNTGLASSDLNIGSGSSQYPSACTSTNYFYYTWGVSSSWPGCIYFYATRCTSGGKSPQSTISPNYSWYYATNAGTGEYHWGCDRGATPGSNTVFFDGPPGSCP